MSYDTGVYNTQTVASSTDDINDTAIVVDKKDPRRGEKKSVFKKGFEKAAGGPGSAVSHNNTQEIDFLETSPIISIGYRQKFMDTHKPVSTSTKIPISRIKYKGQEKMVPRKLVKMMMIWDKVKDKAIDVIQDSEGNYHILDGHHRALAAILKKESTVIANVYMAPRELE